jgi:type IV secretory pathway VirB3-like protein
MDKNLGLSLVFFSHHLENLNLMVGVVYLMIYFVNNPFLYKLIQLQLYKIFYIIVIENVVFIN